MLRISKKTRVEDGRKKGLTMGKSSQEGERQWDTGLYFSYIETKYSSLNILP